MFHRTAPSPATFASWSLSPRGRRGLVRDVAAGLVEQGRSEGVRGDASVIVDVDVTEFLYRLDPGVGRVIDGAWHVLRHQEVFDRFEHSVLPKALHVIQNGGLEAQAHPSIEVYAAKVQRVEHDDRVTTMVTTAYRMIVHLTLVEPAPAARPHRTRAHIRTSLRAHA